MMHRLKGILKNRIAAIARAEARKVTDEWLLLLPQLMAFQQSKPEERQSFYDHTKDPVGNRPVYIRIRDRLAAAGVTVEDVDVDIPAFKQWLGEFPEMHAFYRKLATPTIQKCLEHFMVHRLLDLKPGDIYLDIAASGSPWARFLRARSIEAYRLDLCYPKGIHGIDIGADAADTGLPPGFATAMSAQCAYNCFMGSADTRFFAEAARLLKPGGRCAVIPLCLDDTYFVTRSPFMLVPDFTPDTGALCVWRDDEHRVPFSRHYSPEAFASRVMSVMPPELDGRVLFLRNLVELGREFPGERLYGYFMLTCVKKPV